MEEKSERGEVVGELVEWRWRVWRNREEVGRGGRQHFLTSSPSESSWWFRPEKALSRESLLAAPESTCGNSSSHKDIPVGQVS